MTFVWLRVTARQFAIVGEHVTRGDLVTVGELVTDRVLVTGGYYGLAKNYQGT